VTEEVSNIGADRCAIRPPLQGRRYWFFVAPHELNPPASVGKSSGRKP
jgi:hypothetical protein